MGVAHDASSGFLRRLNAGSDWAFWELDRKYRPGLVAQVAREMDRRVRTRMGPEDPVQSAFRVFALGIRDGKYRIDHKGKLWSLLQKLVRHKMIKHTEYHNARKRTPEREVRPVDGQIFSQDQGPDAVVCTVDLIGQALEGLEPSYPEVFFLRLKGFEQAEIAEELQCTRAAVRHRLKRIKLRLSRLLELDGTSMRST